MSRMRNIFLIAMLGISSSSTAVADGVKLPIRMTVNTGERDRVDALVSLSIPIDETDRASLRLVEITAEKEVPVPMQIDRQDARIWWVATGCVPDHRERTYRLEQGKPPQTTGITIVDSDRTVDALSDAKPLMRYNKAHVAAPSGANVLYGRSAHMHPVWTPEGAVVTDEFPPDHMHQSGIFLAHTKTEFEGREVDFWNLAGGKGRVRCKALMGKASGPVFGQIVAQHEHVDLHIPDGKVAALETWDVRVWNVGLNSGYWLLDITSSVRCATDAPLLLPEYHYGGMAIRAARPWTPKAVRFLTSEGQDRIAGNHSRLRWCDISGSIDSQLVGVAMMTHPANFRFPEPLRIHPTMPYMVYAPAFLGDWDIQSGTHHISRYRFVVHDGELTGDQLARLWKDFAEPLVAVRE